MSEQAIETPRRRGREAPRAVIETDAQFPGPHARVLFKPAPYKVLWGGRGGAKSWSFCRALLILGSRRKLFILCTREFQQSMEESVYKALEDQAPMVGLAGFYRFKDTEIVGANGTRIVFAGLRNHISKIKSMEGIDICAVFEATTISDPAWNVLLPTVRGDPPKGPFGQGSEIWIEFNPELATDATYKRWVLDPPEGTLVDKVSWRENPWFPEILRRQKDDLRRKDPDAYDTVWEGNTRKALEGAIYAKEIAQAISEGRVSPQVKHDKFRPVDVSFDLGRADRTSIWFWQQNGMDHYAIDHYSNCGFGMDHYLAEMQARQYLYRRIYLPHDAAHHHQSAQKSIEMQVREVYPGEGRVKIVPKIGIAAGINVTRAMWPRIYMNEGKCADGITSLQHYRYAVDPDTGQRSPNPLHDWASHDADGLRTYTVGLREDTKPPAAASSGPPRMFRTGQGWMK